MNKGSSRAHGNAAACGSVLLVALMCAGGSSGTVHGAAQPDRGRTVAGLMTQGKLYADLGNHAAAAEAFRTIADDPGAPDALVWEALVRLGLTLSASGDTLGSAEAFRTVRRTYAADAAAMRFLSASVASSVPGKIWIDFRTELEDLLRSAQPVSSQALTPGSANRRVRLVRGEIALDAMWRPAQQGDGASHRKDLAAYELDRLLGLDMVPPTVARTIDGRPGALTVWVYGCRSFNEVNAPQTPALVERLARMRTFDYLIGNVDRNFGNILVDPGWDLVLLDHTRSFPADGAGAGSLPAQLDDRLVRRLRDLDEATLTGRLRDLLDGRQIETLLQRRRAILARVG